MRFIEYKEHYGRIGCSGGSALKKFQSTQPRTSLPTTKQFIACFIALFILIYGLIIVIASCQIRLSMIDNALQKTKLSPQLILSETFGNENSIFRHALTKKERPQSLSHFLLEGLTDLRFDDIRSLFGSELPGFTLYNTKIFYAGKGLTYNTLPQDNPPPEIKLETPRPQKPDKAQQEKDKVNRKLTKLVYIYHTHSWEAYNPLLGSGNTSAVSADPNKDVIYDGQIVGNTLVSHGIGFLHDTSNKNEKLREMGWTYNQAYQYSRLVVQNAMKAQQSLTYFIDIHRDSSGGKLTTAMINGTSYARISIVIGESNPNYSANLYMAQQIKNTLDQAYPGLVRGIVGKNKNDGNGIYNQDLSKNAILIEIGGIDNTRDEVKRTSIAFGDALATYIQNQQAKK